MTELRIGNSMFAIKREWKAGFIATWIFGLLAHAYRFFNFLPTWDSMYNFTGTGATFWSGRCYLGYASGISSKYDLPWVNGALSLLYISVTVVMLIEIFEVKTTLSSALIAGLLVSFPTITSTFAYMFTADGYMIAFMLAVAGVFFAYKWKYGIWAGMVCIGVSIGTYQAYISVAIVVIMMVVIRDLLIKRKTFKSMFLDDWKYGALMVGGFVFYKITDSMFNAYYGVTLTDYQGIGSMGIMSLSEYAQALYKSLRELAHLLNLQDGISWNNYTIANAAVFAGIALGTGILIIRNKTYKNLLGMLVTILAVVLLPIAAFSVNFVSPYVEYHTLMEMAVCFVYVLLVVYIEHGNWEARAEKALKAVGVIVLAFLIYYNTINANIAYMNMNLSYQKTYAICLDLLGKIEDTGEYPDITAVAIYGTYHAKSGGIDDMIPEIMGVSNDTYLNGEWHYISMWNYCFGRAFGMQTAERKAALAETEEYLNMPAYPKDGCVQIIDNCIVIKMSE